MTIATYQPGNGLAPAATVPTAADQSSKGVARIIQWAESAQAAHDLAEVLCRTSFCPEQFREKPGEATAAILAGGEVGLSPMAALNSFDIIQGRAAARAITLRAVVQSFGHEVELVESTSARCRMRGRRRGAEAWQSVEWTIQRAQQLGLTNKSNWKSQPTAMLLARATSEVCRIVAADAILGIGYAVEELEDMAAEQQPAGAGTRRVQRQTTAKQAPAKAIAAPSAPAQEDEDLLGEGEPVPPTQEPQEPAAPALRATTSPVTAAQLRMLGVNWTRLGVTDDLERRTLTGLLVGRDIGDTTKNLTVAEAIGLIDRLTKIEDRDALEQALQELDQSSLDTEDS